MALFNLGLSGSPYTTSSNGYRVYESADSSVGSSGHPIRLVWTTEFGPDVQDTFTFTVRWRAWERGMSLRTAWSETYAATFNASACSPQQPVRNGRWWWSHDLDVDGLLYDIADSGGAFRYDTRRFDQIDMTVSLYTNYTTSEGVKRKSETATVNLYVGHIPKYEITSVYYEESDLMVIEYETTWERKDDRYCFEELYVSGYGSVFDQIEDESFSDIIHIEDETASALKGNTWGTVTALGRIEVPTKQLTQHLKGKSVYLDIRFNASYRPADLDFANARGYYEVEDRTICNTPTLRVTASDDPYSVSVLTGDSGDLGAPIEKVTVKLFGGKYDADEVTVSPGEVATLRFVPFATPLVVEAVGSRGKATSRSVAASAGRIDVGGITVLDSIAEEERVTLQWNQTHDITSAGERETIKLARRRPSAFYGTGGTTAFSMQAVLIDEDGRDLERLPEYGDVMVRIHDGRRYAIAMEAGVSWDGPRIRTVTVSGEEVDA